MPPSIEEDVRIGVNKAEITNDLKAVETSIKGITSAFKQVTVQVDDVIKHIENLTAVATNANTTVNKTFNNANTYNTNKKITKVSTSKASDTFAVGDTVMSFKSGSNTAAAKKAQQMAIDAAQEELNIKKQTLETEKQITELKKKQAELTGEKAKNYSQDSESRSKNAAAALLNAETKSKYPWLFGTGANNRNFRYQTGKALQGLGNTVSGMGIGGRIAGYGLDTMGAFLKTPAMGSAAAITNLGKAIKELGSEAVKSFAEIESIKTQLGVVFSNQTQANSMFGEISQYAVKSPFGVQQTSELAVLLKQSGVYATDLMETLKMIGDTAGGNMEKMKRIANNYAQIVSISKASMLDMRQFAYAGIPIFEAVSKELGVSQQELRKLISDGKVTSDIIEKVFKDLTGINGIFENATEKGAKTLKARLQNLTDARQLAFAQAGQRIVNTGTQTGNDSYANRMVTWAEDLYSKLNDWFGRGNIAADVATIARRNDRIKQLEDLIAINKGNEEALKYLNAALERELNKIDVDAQRATYEASYNEKKTKHDEVRNIFGDLSLRDAKNRLYNMQDWYSTDYFSRSYLKDDERYKNFSMLDDAALQEQISLLKEFIQALKDEKEITVEELQAHRESNVINAQQLEFDRANKAAGKEGSYAAGFEKLYGLYTSGEKYKAEQQEKETKWLEESKVILKELLGYKDDNGNIDITKMTYKKLVEYLDEEKRVLDSGRKLTVVEGKSQATMTADREVLTKQYRDIYSKIEGELKDRGDYDTRNELGRLNRNINYNADNKTFFREFSHVLDDELAMFDDLIKNAKSDKDQEFYKDLRKTLLSSTFQYEAPSEKGLEADTNTNISKNQFIPLWKRILSGATGLTTNGMTDTASTMKNYRDDMAIRNMTAGVLSATMKSMGIDTAMSLMRTNNSVKLTGDNGKTFQVDWLATKKAIHNFATQLSASTEVISAYKKGLEDELDVYEQLIAAGYTQAESADLGSQKFVSSKQLAKLGLGNESQLVNAFGEILTTASGKKYNVADVSFRDGEMYDKFGNKIEEEVVITGQLFEFIKGEMPRLYNELHEANVAEAKNKVLNSMFTQATPTQLALRFLSGSNNLINTKGKNLDAVRFLQQFPDFAQSVINTSLTKSQESTTFPALKGLSNEQILTYAYRTKGSGISKAENDTINAASAALSYAFTELENAILDLLNSDVFKGLKDNIKNQSRDENVMQDYLSNQWYKTNGLSDPSSLTPRYYEGFRGFRNRLFENITGRELKYDKEDYIATKLRAEPETVEQINEERRKRREKEIARNPEYELKPLELISAEDLNPLIKTNEELAKMLSLSEQINLTWGEESADIGKTFDDIGKKSGELLKNFAVSALTSSFELWGKTLATTADDSKEIGKNLASMSASLLSNMGSMLTQAGLSLAISSIGDKTKVMAGLAIAAAGGGLSIVSGYLNGALSDNKNEKDSEYEKLLKVKQDLSDLLKQARADAIYYENTLRHKNAIGANEQFKTKSVNDAIITPSGQVVTTDPKDYLIATKTPQQFVSGGAPTINFSVIDKSTGIKVTQQRSTYDEKTNSIEFEAIIESKVQEIIATSKGDDAFNAREARINGRTVIA